MLFVTAGHVCDGESSLMFANCGPQAILHADRRRRHETEDSTDHQPTPFLHHYSPDKNWIRRVGRMTEQERYEYMWYMREEMEVLHGMA